MVSEEVERLHYTYSAHRDTDLGGSYTAVPKPQLQLEHGILSMRHLPSKYFTFYTFQEYGSVQNKDA